MDCSFLCNRNNKYTNYYIGIKGINIEKEIIDFDIFNPFKIEKLLKIKIIFILNF